MGSRSRSLTRLAAVPGKQHLAVALAACAAVIGLSACGSSAPKTIPQASADAMLSDLDAAQRAASTGDCDLALANADAFANDVNALPATVGDDVKTPLQEAATRLKALASDSTQCQPITGATGASDVPPAPEPRSTTTTDSTTTTSTTTTTSSTSTPEPPTPPSNGGGDEGGGPSGGGGGKAGGGAGGTGGIGTGTGGTGG
jgi:hypothetical protein